ncbi:MAG: DUF1501 domain-containing protein [Deltaproteobacteria bacterium]|nr:DUF1501 domain-containing protein [Deltaproteobacteria bacterium]MBI3389497.1 DUF1501 domain-containing protein [Deltaproteobacteria bacterium]
MAITRRQFLKRTGALTAGSFLSQGLFRNPLFLQQAMAAIGDRYLVVVFLDGGNDGLNTVVPLGDVGSSALRAAYEAARGTGPTGLRLDTGILTQFATDPNTGTPLALHPGMSALLDSTVRPHAAVIQGAGYPSYSLSHDESRTAWQTGNPLGDGAFPNGWVGRYLAANYGSLEIPGVAVRSEVPGEFRQRTTNVLTINRVKDFDFPYDPSFGGDDNAKRTAYLALCDKASSSMQPTFKYIGDSGTSTLLSTESYPQVEGPYNARSDGTTKWYKHYSNSIQGEPVGLNTGFARNLREVAKMIYGVSQGIPAYNPLTTRFFEVANGGYDTHRDQGIDGANDQQNGLHHEVFDALSLFYKDCLDMGVANKVLVLVWSEFSRRIPQNDSGTDHGSQGPVFVIGGTVNGGVAYGNHPNINGVDSGAPQALDDDGNTPYSQAPNNLSDLTLPFRSTDIRDIYGTILKHWLNLDDATTQSFLPLDTGMDPDTFWTVPNFGLGFLP